MAHPAGDCWAGHFFLGATMLVIPNEDGTYPDNDDQNVSDPTPTNTDDPTLNADADPEADPEPAPEPTPRQDPDLAAQLAEEREARIRLEERLRAQEEARKTEPKKEEPQPYTRQELRAAVNEGKIDEDQMEEIWAKQQRELIQRDMRNQLEERDQVRSTESFVDTEMEKYISAYPGVKQVGSDEWKRVKNEYDFLIKMGDKDEKATELKALRAAFGPNTERIPKRTAALRETPADAAGSPGEPGNRPVDIWNRVPKHLRAYYKDRVSNGFMTLEDVKKDIPYMTEQH
jgi:hypothetical protein